MSRAPGEDGAAISVVMFQPLVFFNDLCKRAVS